MNNKINLENLTDQQKVWLTQLSYLNINAEGINRIKNGGLTISELSNYLANPTAQMYGNVFGNQLEGLSKMVVDAYIGKKDGLITNTQLLQELINAGLGNIKITAIQNDSTTGFQAMAFEDESLNTGISYRGSDCEWGNGGLADWLIADIGEFITNNSKQSKQAIEFFDNHKSSTGQNYIYGHSLGGNLTAHTYLERYSEITQAFSFNGLPVGHKLIDTKEKVAAFNDSKFECTVVGGDVFQHIKEDNLYADKVKFIKNNNEGNNNWLFAHLPQSVLYDENGNFITITREEAIQNFTKARQWFVTQSKKINLLFGNQAYEISKFIEQFEEKITQLRNKLNLGSEPLINAFNGLLNQKQDNPKMNININQEEKVNLETITEQQKMWLSQLSYLDINEEGRKKIAEGGITVSELKLYLENPKEPFTGNMCLGDQNFINLSEMMFGVEQFPNKEEMLDEIIKNGLGNLKITNISEPKTMVSSGFQAITFQDHFGNTGISYRGSDFDLSTGGVRDWVEADLLEYFLNGSTQSKEAIKYFNDNKNQNGNNYIYGHSLGGNLTSHVYVQHYNEIQEAFTINGNPINQSLLDTPEKIAAFNDQKKYNCNIICGDIVGHLKDYELYEDNVKYIKNNDTMTDSFVTAHMVQAATIDSEGNFVYDTKEQSISKMDGALNFFTKFTQTTREIFNQIEDKMDLIKNGEKTFDDYKETVLNWFRKKINEIDKIKDQKLQTQFQQASEFVETEILEQIEGYIYNNLEQEKNVSR